MSTFKKHRFDNIGTAGRPQKTVCLDCDKAWGEYDKPDPNEPCTAESDSDDRSS